MGDGLRVVDERGAAAGGRLLLASVGVRPAAELATSSGVRLGEHGAIRVDQQMATNLPATWAAGDCTETYHRLLRRPAYLPLGTTAHKQERVAGENAIGGRRQFEGALGTQVVKVFDMVAARTGVRDAEAQAAGLDPLTVQVVCDDHNAYAEQAVDQLNDLDLSYSPPLGSPWDPLQQAAQIWCARADVES
jgi:NADPH-dependent 2,4-dienoyl-CoA reductase/sulfur reductase-like enzyme